MIRFLARLLWGNRRAKRELDRVRREFYQIAEQLKKKENR